MNRLPSVDPATQRSELAIFTSLGLAGFLMVVLAVFQVTGEVTSGRDFNAARAGWTKQSGVSTTADSVQPAATNSGVGGLGDAPVVPQARANSRIRSAGESALGLPL